MRFFSTSVCRSKAACASVAPVHHTVRISKRKLSPRFPELLLPASDIHSPRFRPQLTHPDRVGQYYFNSLAPDLLLQGYRHGQKPLHGNKRREWDMSSPYHINRSLRKPKGQLVPSMSILPRDHNNIPRVQSIVINCFAPDAKLNQSLAISAILQMQQITGVKPEAIYAKTNVPNWKLRPGMKMGAKVELKGRYASQFISTLTEIVLPRSREYRGISNKAGDKYGTVAFGLTPDQVKFFPEIELNQDSWPITFGFNVSIITTAQTTAEARTLLSGLGFPFTGSEKIPKTILNDLE